MPVSRLLVDVRGVAGVVDLQLRLLRGIAKRGGQVLGQQLFKELGN